MEKLAKVLAGDESKPYIIAEISANHNGNFQNARQLVLSAKNAGADAIKLQTFTADSITVNTKSKIYSIPSKSELWAGRNLWELMKEAETPIHWHRELFQFAKTLGLEAFSTAYDEAALDFLLSEGVGAIKIASFDLINLPLLRNLAERSVIVLLSTGMARIEEIKEAVEFFEHRKSSVGIFQCTSSYPCSLSDVNINRHTLLKSLGFVTGYSDHTKSSVASILAVGQGAMIFEKHICLTDKSGLDSDFSLTPSEFKDYVSHVHDAFKCLGNFEFSPVESESASLWERPSVVAISDIFEGQKLTKENIGIRRPSIGVEPKHFDFLLNRVAKANLRKGEGIPNSFLC